MSSLIGVVSDTHAQVENARAGVRMLESFEIQAVLHCGDIGSPAVMALFEKWPAHFVLGNTDHDPRGLAATVSGPEHRFHGRFGAIELLGKKIALLHGDDYRLLRESIASGQYDVVCSGHTHIPHCETVGSTLVLNPGALYRANPHTLAILDLETMKAEIISV